MSNSGLILLFLELLQCLMNTLAEESEQEQSETVRQRTLAWWNISWLGTLHGRWCLTRSGTHNQTNDLFDIFHCYLFNYLFIFCHLNICLFRSHRHYLFLYFALDYQLSLLISKLFESFVTIPSEFVEIHLKFVFCVPAWCVVVGGCTNMNSPEKKELMWGNAR